jgi:cytoskeletal protein CcmA (bactofilin family)
MTQALPLYSAALAEEEVALNLLKAAHAGAQTLFVFQKSAASLALKCANWSRASRLIEAGLRLDLRPPMYEELQGLPTRIPKAARPVRKTSYESQTPASAEAAVPISLSNVLLEDVEIRGTLKHVGALLCNGKLTGVIISETGTISIGTGAEICGDLFSKSALISGKIFGSITVQGSCQLGPTCRVLGNIASPRLNVAEGATFVGEALIVPPGLS